MPGGLFSVLLHQQNPAQAGCGTGGCSPIMDTVPRWEWAQRGWSSGSPWARHTTPTTSLVLCVFLCARLRCALQAGVSDSPCCLCREGEWQNPQGPCLLQPSCPPGETDSLWLGTDPLLGPGRLHPARSGCAAQPLEAGTELGHAHSPAHLVPITRLPNLKLRHLYFSLSPLRPVMGLRSCNETPRLLCWAWGALHTREVVAINVSH